MGRVKNRHRNKKTVDSWLDGLGYTRKHIVEGESSFFRAVADQVLYSQFDHEKIIQECTLYGKKHSKEFVFLLPNKRDWNERLQRIKHHMQICTGIEIQLICNTYKTEVTVFNANNFAIEEFYPTIEVPFREVIYICRMNGFTYDSIYNKHAMPIIYPTPRELVQIDKNGSSRTKCRKRNRQINRMTHQIFTMTEIQIEEVQSYALMHDNDPPGEIITSATTRAMTTPAQRNNLHGIITNRYSTMCFFGIAMVVFCFTYQLLSALGDQTPPSNLASEPTVQNLFQVLHVNNNF